VNKGCEDAPATGDLGQAIASSYDGGGTTDGSGVTWTSAILQSTSFLETKLIIYYSLP
jgi:hypothetical protein